MKKTCIKPTLRLLITRVSNQDWDLPDPYPTPEKNQIRPQRISGSGYDFLRIQSVFKIYHYHFSLFLKTKTSHPVNRFLFIKSVRPEIWLYFESLSSNGTVTGYPGKNYCFLDINLWLYLFTAWSLLLSPKCCIANLKDKLKPKPNNSVTGYPVKNVFSI